MPQKRSGNWRWEIETVHNEAHTEKGWREITRPRWPGAHIKRSEIPLLELQETRRAEEGKKDIWRNNTWKLPNLIFKNDKSTDQRNSTNPQQGKHTPPLPSTSCSSYRKPVMKRTSEARKGRHIASSGGKKVYQSRNRNHTITGGKFQYKKLQLQKTAH